MGSDWAIVRRAAIPFFAGAAASAALFERLYATALLSVLIALWAAAMIQQAIARRADLAATVPPRSAAPSEAAERQRLHQYLDLSPAPLVILSGRGRLHAVNRAARQMFGCEDLVARPAAELVTAIADVAPGRSATVRIKAGSMEHVFALATADLHTGGDAARVAALIDIDADLKAAEAAALRDLVQVLSHEITNTLTPIASLSASAASMIAEPGSDPVAIREALETVARRALGLQRFGEAYRDLARLPPPERRSTDLVALIGDLARLFATRWPDVALTIQDMPAMLDQMVDADQIAQALWAVLQNGAEVARHVSIAATLTETGAIVRIGDDGPGISPVDADAIFRPFYTTKAAGSGIGLALARQVLRGHGGDLTLVTGDAGKTCFEASLPRQGLTRPNTA